MDANFFKLINHEPYELVVRGEKIFVHNGVFAPDPGISYSTEMILKHLPEVEGREVLDMGTGTGVIAIICGKKGARKIVAVL